MLRLLALIALTAAVSLAQISGLATTDVGAQLYFSTPLRLRSAHRNFYPKILRYVGVFQPFREVETQSTQPDGLQTNFFQLTDPQVSGDGTVVAYTANSVCTAFPDQCIELVLQQGKIVGANIAASSLNDGTIRLSGDKRFALMINGELQPFPRLIDLATGAVTEISGYFPIGDGRQAFADDGSILLQVLPQPQVATIALLWTPTSEVQLRISQTPLLARLSRNGAKVVYEAAGQNDRMLIAYDVSSGTETTLATAPLGSPNDAGVFQPHFNPWITNDGSTILFESTDSNGVQQAFLIQSDGSNSRQITREPEGVSEATLSGYGGVVYAVTPQARLVRIETASGDRTELAPPSAQVSSISAAALGSLAQLSGHGLAAITAVQLNNEPVPLYTKSDAAAVIQIPWDAPTSSPALIQVEDHSNSPFEGALMASLWAVSPSFLPFGTGITQIPLAVHEHSTALVTLANPAVAGEIITLYLTGMGPVTGVVQTGVPAPLKPLQPVVNPFTCMFFFKTPIRGGGLANAPVLFAGLVPTLVGVYAMNLEVPALPTGALPGMAILNCMPPYSVPVGSEAWASLPIANK